MKPIFRFVKNDRAGAIHDFTGHFFFAVRRQAVHEQRVIVCLVHQVFVHLIRAQLVVAPFFSGLAVVHRDPSIGNNQISPFDGLIRIPFDLNRTARFTRQSNKFVFGICSSNGAIASRSLVRSESDGWSVMGSKLSSATENLETISSGVILRRRRWREERLEDADPPALSAYDSI